MNKYQVEAIATLYRIFRSNGFSHKETSEALKDTIEQLFEEFNKELEPKSQPKAALGDDTAE